MIFFNGGIGLFRRERLFLTPSLRQRQTPNGDCWESLQEEYRKWTESCRWQAHRSPWQAACLHRTQKKEPQSAFETRLQFSVRWMICKRLFCHKLFEKLSLFRMEEWAVCMKNIVKVLGGNSFIFVPPPWINSLGLAGYQSPVYCSDIVFTQQPGVSTMKPPDERLYIS